MLLICALAFFVSLCVTVLVGLFLIPALRRIGAGQSIREDGPVWHNKKEGTPTMGGVMFIAGTATACITVGFAEMKNGGFNHIYMLIFALVYSAVGFYDDFVKLKNKRNMGLRGWHKFALQLVVAALFIILLRVTGSLSPEIYIPFINVGISLPEPLYFIFAALAALGAVNGANLTDGADGLAAGATIPIAICFAAVSILWSLTATGIYAAALAGGLIAFLFFNFYPAKVFMGDTGAQFLGGAVCAMAFVCDMPLILIPLGIIYFIEVLSDIIQVAYYKLSHGKRVFKMAPLHHHFELIGWSERKLFTIFTAVSAIFAVISFFGVRNRY